MVWEGKTSVSRICFELQRKKLIWEPSFIRECVNSYVIGKIQYGAALYWLRGSKESVDKTRFDYINAMSAACGLTAPETLGLLLCRKGAKVSPENKNYLKLCKKLDLPTLKDMAIRQARRMIKQWAIFEPALFSRENNKIISIRAPAGSLLSDLYLLSTEELNDWYPEYHKAKKTRNYADLKYEDYPEWSQCWKRAVFHTKQVYAEHLKREPTTREIMNT